MPKALSLSGAQYPRMSNHANAQIDECVFFRPISKQIDEQP